MSSPRGPKSKSSAQAQAMARLDRLSHQFPAAGLRVPFVSVCACDFTECCTVSQPTVSHHLKVLREAGVVTTRRQGTYIYYRLLRLAALGNLSTSLAGLVAIA